MYRSIQLQISPPDCYFLIAMQQLELGIHKNSLHICQL